MHELKAKTDTRIKLRAYPKRLVLREYETNELVDNIFSFFDTTVNVPRIKVGFKSTINTLMNEEALLFAKYVRNERSTWIPRIAVV